MYHVIAAPALCTINMASGINIYSELLISRIPVLDINNANWVRSNVERLGAYRIGTYRRRKLHTQLRTREKECTGWGYSDTERGANRYGLDKRTAQ